MLPDLPVFIPKQVYFLTGKFLARLVDRVAKQTPLEGDGIDFEETAKGIIPHIRGGAATSVSMQYGFAASWKDADEVTIAPGIVAWTDWASPTWTAPAPSDWLAEWTTTSTDVVVADGDSVWLEITLPATDANLIGPLPTDGATPLSVTSGGGGAGGDGAGGGGGGDGGGIGTDGGAGADAVGAVGGAEGASPGTGGTSPGDGSGDPANGGNGGNGGAGGAGEVVNFAHYSNLRLRVRRYSVYSTAFVPLPSGSSPTSTATTIYVRIASVSGGVITQHHAGTYALTLPTISFVA